MTDRVLSDFIDAWNAGRRPAVDDYLERVPERERDELGARLLDWLSVAPDPAYPAPAREAIRADPRFQAAVAATGRPPGTLGALRARAGLGLAELAARVVAAFGLTGQEARAAGYLERLERGELDEWRVSTRLLDVLGAALGEPVLVRPRPAAPMLFRGGERATEQLADELELLSRAALAPAPPPMDALDRLFLGGP